MPLSERVHVARRFARSIRIDADLEDATALEGFVCPQSSADVLSMMAHHVTETGQGAFTWTGPYGSGKSSLAAAFSALLNGNADLKKKAAGTFQKDLTDTLHDAFRTRTKEWRILPVVAHRGDPVAVIGDAVKRTKLVSRQPSKGWTERNLLDALTREAAADPQKYGGLLFFIDEMGKFLESAAQDGTDIYFLQQLAEAASRSNGRLLFIGVLHQSFDEYTHNLSRETQEEWAKIQGRFIDLIVNASGEEQLELIGRAIESLSAPEDYRRLAAKVAGFAHPDRAGEATRTAALLKACWPLHPVVACLLGPVSRRRFGQNQRSIFGFLNSSEPHGFQDFLKRAGDGELYGPERLWDYLRVNLEPSILASPDGHRWTLATEAMERCEAQGNDDLHVRLLKVIAIVGLFGERSGFAAANELLRCCFPDIRGKSLEKALSQLEAGSFAVFRKYLDAWSIFAGSDFDIERAVTAALGEIDEIDFKTLKSLAGLQPFLAKRHYHETGAMRWFDMNIVSIDGLDAITANPDAAAGMTGQFVLAIPTKKESEAHARDLCRKAARHSGAQDMIVGVSARVESILPLARELQALNVISNEHPELAGDAVARKEVATRIAILQAQVEAELHKAFNAALWFQKGRRPRRLRQVDLNNIASELADQRFSDCPRLHNELINRQKPSTSAVAAQNNLLRHMVMNEGRERLGIEGFSAHAGLFTSILEAGRLYAGAGRRWRFTAPAKQNGGDPLRLAPAWQRALDFLREEKRPVALSELFAEWRKPPLGVKDGIMPILAVAFILSQKNELIVYREGLFKVRLDDVDAECLARNPDMIQLRWMSMRGISRQLLSEMAQVAADLGDSQELAHLEPIDVARGLVAIYDRLPRWTRRTTRLSANAVRIREFFNRADDPIKLLFNDLPAASGGDGSLATQKDLERTVRGARGGLEELVNAYPDMLQRLLTLLLDELRVPNASPESMAELRERAENIKGVAGDFRLNAFIGRMAQFDGGATSIEGVAGLAVNKPPQEWVDSDLDQGTVEIADLAQQFIRTEAFAHVKGRPDNRQALAVVIGLNGRATPMVEEFGIADSDQAGVDNLVKRMGALISSAKEKRREIVLAALAKLSAQYLEKPAPAKKTRKKTSGTPGRPNP